MKSEYLTRERMLAALERLGDVLQSRGVEAQLYIVGGAAMAFAYLSDRVTRDIDAIALPAEAVFDVARELIDELDLPEEWLNDTAKAFLPDVSLTDGQIVLERPGIVVRTAPAEVVLAMKLLAARAKDIADIRLLAAMLEITTSEGLWAVFLRYYPSGRLVEHSEMLIETVFA